MEKANPVKQFSHRLKEAMAAAGMNSERSTSGVCIHKLAEITGYSVQICRRYLKGEATPDPSMLVLIAEKLNVSPGWLLFGDGHITNQTKNNVIQISKHLLHYIFTHASALYKSQSSKEVPDFLMNLVYDISQINANEQQSKKIIDLALSSANYFNEQYIN